MSELSEIKDMLKSHIKASNEWMGKVDNFIGKTEVHHGYTQKTIEQHGEDITILQATQERQRGALWLFGIIAAFFGFIAKIFVDLFKHTS